MNKYLLVLCLFCFSNLCAQQDAQYNRYMFSTVIFNPAYIGRLSLKKLDATAIYRQQWAGLNGAPKTFFTSVYGSLNKKGKVNVGMLLENDVIGIHNRLNFYGMYAYKVTLGKVSVSMGVGGGLLSQTSDWTKLDNIQDLDDPSLAYNKILKPDFEIGALFELKEKFWVGISARHLTALVDKDFLLDTNYFLTGETRFPISDLIEMRPSILIKAVYNELPEVVADFNANLIIQEQFGVGVGYQTAQRIAVLFQYWAPLGFKFGYGFDYNLKTFGSNWGSHELMTSYTIMATRSRPGPRSKGKKQKR
ncbi:MAG TPA: PorP/SprF family type IX secretion system membrane protein [Chitinophagales bacterium]|nr:PorP/SprF family type IX secretion system membrane protein [Chitinophagales bacterium]HRK28404.1 PorP/SprF family type IX secretion system membrane protein [Chitinophagales bacterium]